jgi:NADPH-dependent 2,4-dienoyl-CoA reductase/sulfur reductase-like enzyme
MKTIIIGGVAAGMSAASKIRRGQYDSEVVVYEKGSTLSYGACGLPYFISNVIQDENKLIARTKEQFEDMGIDIFIRHEVIDVDDTKKNITIKNLQTNQIFTDSYDKLLIASGASPIVFPWEGRNLDGIYTLSSLDDGKFLKNKLQNQNIQNIVIIGAGFIGVELVETMLKLQKNVTLIELQNQILPVFDKEITKKLEEELKDHGATVKLGEKVLHFEGEKTIAKVVTDKNVYNADLVVVAVGVKPNTSFIQNTNIATLQNGAIIVNAEMQTNVQDIYAAGDCASINHLVHNSNQFYIPLGTNANKQGRVAGENILGNKKHFPGALGTTVIKVCSMEAGKTGISEKEAIRFNYDYKTTLVKSYNHASYYPNPLPMWIKLIYQKRTHRILGAEIVGYDQSAIRINMIAVAIHNNMTTEELGMVDFCYAPPFAGVWDAVHIAANSAK